VKTIHSEAYKQLIEWLIKKRLIAGVTQQQLSEKLHRPQSFVSKYENFERRLDFIETLEICFVLKANPHDAVNLISEGKK
jgi:transcriptional regulator with XRE-family HTH domain